VCDLLEIPIGELVGASRITPNAKLALATIADIAYHRGGLNHEQLAIKLKLPRRKVDEAVEASDEGMLDAIAAHHNHRDAITFLDACLVEFNTRLGFTDGDLEVAP
jgi:hypothetical protein